MSCGLCYPSGRSPARGDGSGRAAPVLLHRLFRPRFRGDAMTTVSVSQLAFQAAELLDVTHSQDVRGPRTHQARRVLAIWLDTGAEV